MIQQLQLKEKQFSFEVDTGAKVNFCSKQVWTKLGRPLLQPARVCYGSATGDSLQVLGAFNAKVFLENPTRVNEIALNVSSLSRLHVLGRTAIRHLGIIIDMLL